MASGVELATAYVSLTVEASKIAPETAKQFGAVEKQADKSGRAAGTKLGSGVKSGLGGMLKGVGGMFAGVMAGIGVKNFIGDALGEARESQKVGALTTSVIKATGGAAKVSADQVGALAGALSAKTGIDDEVIQSGQNMLLTFKNIRNEAGKGNDIFNQSTSVLTDMAAAMGTEPKQAAIQLGKALNDPIKGVAALGRVGVTFTDGQKKQIKTLVESGKTMDAQKIILKELNSEFGGAAAAQATAGDKAKVAMGNLKETIGTALLPVVDKLANFFTDKVAPGISGFVKGMQDGTGAGGKFRDVISNVVDKVKDFIADFKNGEGTAGKFREVLEKIVSVARDVAKWIGDNATTVKILAGALAGGLIAFQAITTAVKIYTGVQAALNFVLAANPIGLIIIAIAALVGGLIVAYKNSETFRKIVKGAFDAIGAAARFMWNNVVAPVIRFLIGAFIKVTEFYATLLRGLSKIPGFGWAKGAADKLQTVANKAAGIKDAIHDIPDKKTVDVSVNFKPTSGRIKVGSEYVNVGMRASGGPVTAGTPYIVGENEPELFVPNRSGTILNQRQIAAAAGGGKTDLSDSSIYRLASALRGAPLQATISAGSVDAAMARAL